MSQDKAVVEISWAGPYGWPQFEPGNNLPPVPELPGVYLQAVEYQDGYLTYVAGLTRRSVPKRFREHTRKYMSGDYNVLDIVAMQQGVRREVWHGWGWSPEKRAEFEERKPIILGAVRDQLAGFRIFVAHIGTESRILERLEAAVMTSLYKQPPPFCDIPDKGMMLSPRRKSENPIVVKNTCAVILHGLPECLEL